MFNRIILQSLICVLAILFLHTFTNHASAQSEGNISDALPAPRMTTFVPETNNNTPPFVQNFNSRWFGENVSGTNQFFKSYLNTPGTQTYVGGPTSNQCFGAAMANGIYYALRYTGAGSGQLLTIDTSSGAMTTISSLSGLTPGHVVSGLAFDKNTGVMYASSTNSAGGTLYKLNLTNGVLTTIGQMYPMVTPIEIAINNSGVIYSWDAYYDALFTVNKLTGAASYIGPLGIDILYAQGGGFDPATDSLFLTAYMPSVNASGLYRCNTNTGAAAFIGSLGNYSGVPAEVDAVVIPSPPATVILYGAATGNGGYQNLTSAFNVINSSSPIESHLEYHHHSKYN